MHVRAALPVDAESFDVIFAGFFYDVVVTLKMLQLALILLQNKKE